MLNTVYVLCMILAILLMFTLMVVSHEWGHYITAKKAGVLVHEFAVGMGPIVWSKQKGETLYSVRLLPIGGFCRMEGEEGESTNPRAMSAKKPWQKLIIVSAGAIMNFILAWVLCSICVGYSGIGTNVIGQIEQGSPADKVGLMQGDEILSINGKEVKLISDLSSEIAKTPSTYTLTVKRDGKVSDIKIASEMIGDEKVPRFGIRAEVAHFRIWDNIKYGFETMIMMIVQVWKGLVGLLTGVFNLKDMSGPVGIMQASNTIWNEGISDGGLVHALMNMVSLTAMLSANLGVMNLLPFPALDGGRIIFILIEMIRGKAISAEKEGAVHFVGMVLLMLLTVVVLYNDIVRWIG